MRGNTVTDCAPINFLNRDKSLNRDGNTLSWQALTTGNFGGFDMVLDNAEGGTLWLNTPLIRFERAICDIGFKDAVYDNSGDLPRFIRTFRLPTENNHRSVSFSRKIALKESGDNPIHIRLTQEDGTRAWTSPIYVFR